MEQSAYHTLAAMAREPEALEATVRYLADRMGKFLRRQDRVLICFPVHTPDTIGGVMERAVLRVGAVPVICGPDYRWKTLMKQAFSSHATAIIGPPLTILGLTKVARATGTPLFIRNVVTAGYPCLDWMIEGIRKKLDCNIWGCISYGIDSMILGFSCRYLCGLHLREDVFGVEILDGAGNVLPDGAVGDVMLYAKRDPSLRFPAKWQGWLERSACLCGDASTRLLTQGPRLDADVSLASLGEELLTWTSILDCRFEKGEYGLELEVVVFPGGKLPRLPSCAKLVVRAWDPEKDAPAWIPPAWRKDLFPGKFY